MDKFENEDIFDEITLKEYKQAQAITQKWLTGQSDYLNVEWNAKPMAVK